MSFRILTVCTANQCRSPLAEFALRRVAEQAGLDWTIGSAGTRAYDGHPPDPKVTEILTRSGATVEGWGSRRLDTELLAQADLVLVMERAHRSDIALMDPGALSKTHLLLAFAEQVADVDRAGVEPGSLGPFLAEQGTRRPLQPAASSMEVDDPVGRPRRFFRRCAAELDEAAQQIVVGRS